MKRFDVRAAIQRPTLAFIIGGLWAAIAICAALWMKHPHFANEMGALLAAFGAVLVVHQVSGEIKLAEADSTDSKAKTAKLSEIEKVRLEQALASRHKLREVLRLKMVMSVSIILAIAEGLHGFGHYVVEYLDEIHTEHVMPQSAPPRAAPDHTKGGLGAASRANAAASDSGRGGAH